MALALVGMSREADQKSLDHVVRTREPGEYALAMLERRKVPWAVDMRANALSRGHAATPSASNAPSAAGERPCAP